MVKGSADKVKELFKKYGKIALGVHFTVYFSFLTGGWMLGSSGWVLARDGVCCWSVVSVGAITVCYGQRQTRPLSGRTLPPQPLRLHGRPRPASAAACLCLLHSRFPLQAAMWPSTTTWM